MSAPAAVLGDTVTATCLIHSIVNPATGAPQPGVPMPFTAPITTGAATRVLIGGRPALVAGATGMNAVPHVLHPSDPYFVPLAQIATIAGGSATVLVEGRPAARSGAPCTVCGGAPGQLAGSAANVLIGG